jgi:hypothetical protein
MRDGNHRRFPLAACIPSAGDAYPATALLVPHEVPALERILPWRASLRSIHDRLEAGHRVVHVSHTPVCGLFLPLSALLPPLLSSWGFEIAMLHHPIEGFHAEGQVPYALVHHPCKGDVRHIAWYVIVEPSSDVRMHTGEPALFKVGTAALILGTWRDVPQGWREGLAVLVYREDMESVFNFCGAKVDERSGK